MSMLIKYDLLYMKINSRISMYRRMQVFTNVNPIKPDEIIKKIKKIKTIDNKIADKNFVTKQKNFSHTLEHCILKDDNIIGGFEYTFQSRQSISTPYQTLHNLYSFILSPNKETLIILGPDKNVGDLVKIISNILYPGIEDFQFFIPCKFYKESIRSCIDVLKAEEGSWCDRFRASHGALKYKGKRTFTDFSNGDDNCVMEDPEFEKHFKNSTKIAPIFKYRFCPHLDSIPHKKPKTLRFNADGIISTSIYYEFEHWYDFIFSFLMGELIHKDPNTTIYV